MKKKEMAQVGFTTKLVVKEDGLSARGFGEQKELKKGEILSCHEVKEINNGEDFIIKVVKEDSYEIYVFFDQVDIAEERYDVKETRVIRDLKDIYKGMELIVKTDNTELALGSKVFAEGDERYSSREILVSTDYDGKFFYNKRWISVGDLGIPKGNKTRKELLNELMNIVEKTEDLTSKEQTLGMLKEMI